MPPPHTGPDARSTGNTITITSAGAATTAISGNVSSALVSETTSSTIRVSRARNAPGAVITSPTIPSLFNSPRKSSGSPKTEVKFFGILFCQCAPKPPAEPDLRRTLVLIAMAWRATLFGFGKSAAVSC